METTFISAIMTKNVVCVSPDQKLVDVKHIYEKKNFHHHIPVTTNGRLVGMVSLIDFMQKVGEIGLDDAHAVYHNTIVQDIMSVVPLSTSADTPVKDVARVLAKGEIHAIPVVEEDKVVGIVSTADLLKHYIEG